MQIPEYINPNPVLLDSIIDSLRVTLVDTIPWLERGFGVAYKLHKNLDGKNVYYPGVYIGKNEYLNVLPDELLGNYMYFEVDDPSAFNSTIKTHAAITTKCSVVFFVNMNRVFHDNLIYRSENIKNDILNALSAPGILKDGRITVLNVYQKAENVFRGYDPYSINNQFTMYPYLCFRFDCEIKTITMCPAVLTSGLPILSATHEFALTDLSVILAGNVNPDGNETTWSIQYGRTAEMTGETPGGVTDKKIDVQMEFLGLIPSTDYFWRLKGVNLAGISYSTINEFQTWAAPVAPVFIDAKSSLITTSGFTITALLEWGRRPTTWHVEYGLTPDMTSRYNGSTVSNDTAIHVDLTGFSEMATVYWRLRAENEVGITYTTMEAVAISSTYYERVLADGGVVDDVPAMNSFLLALTSIYGTLDNHRLIWTGQLGYKERVLGVDHYMSKGYSANKYTPGPERVVNGGFDSSANWLINGTTVNIIDGVARYINANGIEGVYQSGVFQVGKSYKCTLTISNYVSGSIVVTDSNHNLSPAYSANGTYSFITSDIVTSTLWIMSNGGATLDLDNISVYEEITETANDLTQTTELSQPWLSGNIAPNEQQGMLHVNSGDEIMNHPVISFAETDPWSIAVVLNWNCDEYKNGDVWQNLISDAATFNAFFLNYAALHNVYFRNVNGDIADTGASSIKLIGKNNIVHFIANGASRLKVYFNSVFQSELVFPTSFAPSRFGSISGISKAYLLKAGAATQAEITAEYNLLRSIYPEVESVVIGTQEWATSNCDMVATPMGTIIKEVQLNAATERITNIDDREFNVDTGFWSKSHPSIAINSGACHFLDTPAYNVISTSFNLVASKYYRYKVSILNYTSGGGVFLNPGSIGPLTNGDYTFVVKVDNAANFQIYGGKVISSVDIDNVSVQELGWADATEIYDAVYVATAKADSAVQKIPDIADREFTSDTGWWAKPTTVTIADQVAHFIGVGAYQGISKVNAVVIGRLYEVKLTVLNYVEGSIAYQDGGIMGTIIKANGTYTFIVKAGGNTLYFATGGDAINTFDLDNVSVLELGIVGNEANYEYAALKAAAMWCYYNNDPILGATYGKLYNHYAVRLLQWDIDLYNAANPTTPWGWRVPIDTDFNTLTTELGGEDIAGEKLKKEGTEYWYSGNVADNSSGFSMLGAGQRATDGTFNSFTVQAYCLTQRNDLTFYVTLGAAARLGGFSPSGINGMALRLIKA